MPKLTHNPHFAEQPDVSSEKYCQARECLVNDDINHEAAAAQLALYWMLNNDLEKEEWDHQAHQEQQEATERARLDKEEQERQQAEHEREQELVLQEEKKKYCCKYTMVPQDAVVPADPIIIPSQITACRLHKADFVKLYYFTNKGLCDAASTVCSADDNTMTLLQTGDGLHSFIPLASAQAKGTVTKDKDITWEESAEAAHRIANTMKENNWEADNINSHVKFWLALENHPWRHSHCKISKRALLVYQAQVCRRWHDTLDTEQSCNIAHINDVLLA
ncbi:hypothetical protein BKA82DRAFT_120364 [Pisolithus tinctorius]|uniref:Ig-like domain-containing protein n=1 Tax=Pisolithus tinctorius Marx 270 TaxID=870435 RepID=A0A0C3PX72_PISTI|nr:hypothetical protein BKA82DRAFT_120364 [Pisolithus tinctorius]KIO14021.1 hypothetical protein M404DRAFT_120364 [Pisolithus tinctorius Marx 270]